MMLLTNLLKKAAKKPKHSFDFAAKQDGRVAHSSATIFFTFAFQQPAIYAPDNLICVLLACRQPGFQPNCRPVIS